MLKSIMKLTNQLTSFFLQKVIMLTWNSISGDLQEAYFAKLFHI